MTINAKISDYIKSRGIRQNFLAQKLGLDDAKASAMLNGKRKLTASEFLTFCEAFDVDPKAFYERGESR